MWDSRSSQKLFRVSDWKGKAAADEKGHRGKTQISLKNLDFPNDFCENILWPDETKVELYWKVWITPAVKDSGNTVMTWGCFAASGLEEPSVTDGTMIQLSTSKL